MGHKKNDLKNRLLANINVRVPMSIVESAVKAVDVDRLFETESEYYRTAIIYGDKVIALQTIKNDPEKRREFDEKLEQIYTLNDIERTMQTFTESDLRNIEFLARSIREKKVQQLIIDINKK